MVVVKRCGSFAVWNSETLHETVISCATCLVISGGPPQAQQTFSVKGQIVNIFGVRSHTSWVQSLNTAVVSGCSPRRDGMSMAGLGLQKQAGGWLWLGRSFVHPCSGSTSVTSWSSHARWKCQMSFSPDNTSLRHFRILLCKKTKGEGIWGEPKVTSNFQSFWCTFLSQTLPFLERKIWPHREVAHGSG